MKCCCSCLLTGFLYVEDDSLAFIRQAFDSLALLVGPQPDAAVRVTEVTSGLHKVDGDPPLAVVGLIRDEKSFL